MGAVCLVFGRGLRCGVRTVTPPVPAAPGLPRLRARPPLRRQNRDPAGARSPRSASSSGEASVAACRPGSPPSAASRSASSSGEASVAAPTWGCGTPAAKRLPRLRARPPLRPLDRGALVELDPIVCLVFGRGLRCGAKVAGVSAEEFRVCLVFGRGLRCGMTEADWAATYMVVCLVFGRGLRCGRVSCQLVELANASSASSTGEASVAAPRAAHRGTTGRPGLPRLRARPPLRLGGVATQRRKEGRSASSSGEASVAATATRPACCRSTPVCLVFGRSR